MIATTLALAAFASNRPEISYFLPKVRLAASVAHRITRCPTDKDPTLDIEYTPAIAAKASRGRMVVVDASSGFLVDRSTKVGLDNGVLRTFNSTAAGQGGPVIVSLLKAAATAYTLSAPPLAAIPLAAATSKASNFALRRRQVNRPMVQIYVLRCSEETEAALERLAAVEADIGALEARVVAGNDTAVGQLLERRIVQAAALQDGLTLTSTTPGLLDPRRDVDGRLDGVASTIPAPPFERWLVAQPRMVTPAPGRENEVSPPAISELIDREGRNARKPLVGRLGYTVAVTVDARMDRLLGCSADAEPARCSGTDLDASTLRGRDLVYLRPVPATVTLTPIADDCTNLKCPADWGGEAATAAATVLPQLSRPRTMPTGGGSIFGRRTVAAEFDPLGEPASMHYEKGRDAESTTAIVDAVNTVAPDVADARLDALKRQLDAEKTKADLAALLAAKLEQP
ncbi:hypothetical protein [uncultured Sphingomonas sp.]|uniref:hypothetical protein n=1 Tax=uncultured Sphingomonas sp. TaxID=158754 RepID=UPI0035C9573A